MYIICLGNYPPRQCGIATFTENLVNALFGASLALGEQLRVDLIAMNDGESTYDYPEIVKYTIRDRVRADYEHIASVVNNSGADVFLLEHEYGIFGGDSGILLLSLLRNLKIPVVTTLHTILQKPGFHQYEAMKRVAAYSNALVVMNSLAIDFLTSVYGVESSKIYHIQHGVPDFNRKRTLFNELPDSWSGRKVILTFGLIGRSKGIETVLRALPAVVKRHPKFLYVILGKTHPNIIKHYGEEYRDYLKSLILANNLEHHVEFINRYVSEDELVNYLHHADIYITPYLNKAQITSGTLSYAVSSGCAVISTPYWHAEELLADGRGVLFAFGNHGQLSGIINQLADDEDRLKTIQEKAHNYGQTITWAKIGKAYIDLFRIVIPKKKADPETLHESYPDFDISHIRNLTDFTGILQHARANIPCYKAGYCIDDNARAIVLSLAA